MDGQSPSPRAKHSNLCVFADRRLKKRKFMYFLRKNDGRLLSSLITHYFLQKGYAFLGTRRSGLILKKSGKIPDQCLL